MKSGYTVCSAQAPPALCLGHAARHPDSAFQCFEMKIEQRMHIIVIIRLFANFKSPNT